MSFLELQGVTKFYPEQQQPAVKDVSLSIQRGAVVAIVGENGSGKTTLLRLIAGLEDADEGVVTLGDKPITGPAFNLVPGHKEIKILTQDLHLLPKHTIEENIGYNLRGYVEEYQSERLRELTTLLKLQGLEKKRPSQLSGGQQQRAALAAALADEAPVLLLDEPFSSLDVMLKDEVRNKVIRKAREDGTTVLFVTHDVNDALSLADTVVVMRAGRIMQANSPQLVYEKPASEYVAYLFGSINVFSVQAFFRTFPALQNQVATGDGGKVSFRPEYVFLSAQEPGTTEGHVSHAYYFGSHWELEVEAMGETVVVYSEKELSQGEKVWLKLDPSGVHYLDGRDDGL